MLGNSDRLSLGTSEETLDGKALVILDGSVDGMKLRSELGVCDDTLLGTELANIEGPSLGASVGGTVGD